MSRLDVIRAWKDEEYFSNLSETERVSLPENPAGFVELSDADLRGAAGGRLPSTTSPAEALGSCHTCFTGIAPGCEITALTLAPG